MKALFFLYILLLAVAVQPVRADQASAETLTLDGQSITSAPTASSGEPPAAKSPIGACLLSLVIPGLGQHYNGQHVKGAIQEILFAGGAAMLVAALASGSGPLYWADWAGPVGTAGFCIGVGSYLWSAVDAPISANRINMKAQQSRQAPMEFRLVGDSPSLDVGLLPRGIRVGISSRF